MIKKYYPILTVILLLSFFILGKLGPSFSGCYLKIDNGKEVYYTQEDLRTFPSTLQDLQKNETDFQL